jgi:hypothetical protein
VAEENGKAVEEKREGRGKKILGRTIKIIPN